MNVSEVMSGSETQMEKTLEAFGQTLGTIRTGRAHPSLLDRIRVASYGSEVPLSQVASVNAEGALALKIVAWDKTQVPEIEKALQLSDLGLNPVSDGLTIRVALPPLTQERRQSLAKSVKMEGEKARVSIRNARRDCLHAVKEMAKDKTISEDDERRAQGDVQKLTDAFIGRIDQMIETKEQELLEV